MLLSDVRSFNSLRLSLEEAFVWFLVDNQFRELHGSLLEKIDWKRFHFNKALSYAIKNRVLYKFSQTMLQNLRDIIDEKTLQKLNLIVKNGAYDMEKLRNTLNVIKSLWDERVNYFVIKTRDDAPTCDVDVLFMGYEDFKFAIRLACTNGYRFRYEEPFKGWFSVPNGVKVELHWGVSWFGMKVFDDGYLFPDPKKVKLMGQSFWTLNDKAALSLDLAHWIMDVQPLTINVFSILVSKIEENNALIDLLFQAKKYGWQKQLKFHISCLNKLVEYVYSRQLDLPVKFQDVRIRPHFPFFTPLWFKLPFFIKKILYDNAGFALKLNMLQLGMRRYAWSRLWSLTPPRVK